MLEIVTSVPRRIGQLLPRDIARSGLWRRTGRRTGDELAGGRVHHIAEPVGAVGLPEVRRALHGIGIGRRVDQGRGPAARGFELGEVRAHPRGFVEESVPALGGPASDETDDHDPRQPHDGPGRSGRVARAPGVQVREVAAEVVAALEGCALVVLAHLRHSARHLVDAHPLQVLVRLWPPHARPLQPLSLLRSPSQEIPSGC